MSLLRPGAFPRYDLSVEDLPARCTYALAADEAAFGDLCRLRYAAYRREEIIDYRDDGMFRDGYDHDANAFAFGIRIDDRLVGSIRIHVTSRERPRGPALDTYPDLLGGVLAADESFVDPSRFVIGARTSRPTTLALAAMRLACMAAEHFEADWMLAAVRPEHVPFYQRFCALEVLAAPRPYPGLKRPLALLGARNADIRDAVFDRQPVFASTMAERLSVFGTERNLLFRRSPLAAGGEAAAG